MLKILGLTNNHSKGYEYTKRLNSTRNKNSSTKSSKKELSQRANDSTAKKKTRKKNSSKKNSDIYSYKYLQQKALNYIKAPIVNNINYNNNIINATNSNNKSKIKLVSTICLNKNNKNKNKKSIHKRKSIDEQSIQMNKMTNLTTEKKIKEIKIKSNFNLSYVNLFLNKNNNKNKSNNNNDIQNQTTIENNTRMSTVSNITRYKPTIFDEDNYDNYDISREKNKSFLDSISKGIYHRKKLKIFNSSSMEKRPRKQKTIESIEISFSPKVFINKFQPYMNQEQKGLNDINEEKNMINVEESQYELLKALKEKNIKSMIELKKYIVSSIKNNKLDMF